MYCVLVYIYLHLRHTLTFKHPYRSSAVVIVPQYISALAVSKGCVRVSMDVFMWNEQPCECTSMTAIYPSWLKWVIDHSAYTQPPAWASWKGRGGVIAGPGYYYIAHPLCCNHILCAVCGGIHATASIETLIAKQKVLPKHISSCHSKYHLNTNTDSVSHSR